MDIAGLLLTGGRSRRLGRDKATLVTPTGETLARRCARQLAEVATPALELGPGVSGLEHVPDRAALAGPLAAIAGGVRALDARAWKGPALVIATDLPRLGVGLLRWLADHPFAGSVIPEVDGVPQWLCARYGAEALAAAPGLAAIGERAVRSLAAAGPRHLATEAEWQAAATRSSFEDIDRPGDLPRLLSPGATA